MIASEKENPSNFNYKRDNVFFFLHRESCTNYDVKEHWITSPDHLLAKDLPNALILTPDEQQEEI